jgi:hypothetical protein
LTKDGSFSARAARLETRLFRSRSSALYSIEEKGEPPFVVDEACRIFARERSRWRVFSRDLQAERA